MVYNKTQECSAFDAGFDAGIALAEKRIKSKVADGLEEITVRGMNSRIDRYIDELRSE